MSSILASIVLFIGAAFYFYYDFSCCGITAFYHKQDQVSYASGATPINCRAVWRELLSRCFYASRRYYPTPQAESLQLVLSRHLVRFYWILIRARCSLNTYCWNIKEHLSSSETLAYGFPVQFLPFETLAFHSNSLNCTVHLHLLTPARISWLKLQRELAKARLRPYKNQKRFKGLARIAAFASAAFAFLGFALTAIQDWANFVSRPVWNKAPHQHIQGLRLTQSKRFFKRPRKAITLIKGSAGFKRLHTRTAGDTTDGCDAHTHEPALGRWIRADWQQISNRSNGLLLVVPPHTKSIDDFELRLLVDDLVSKSGFSVVVVDWTSVSIVPRSKKPVTKGLFQKRHKRRRTVSDDTFRRAPLQEPDTARFRSASMRSRRGDTLRQNIASVARTLFQKGKSAWQEGSDRLRSDLLKSSEDSSVTTPAEAAFKDRDIVPQKSRRQRRKRKQWKKRLSRRHKSLLTTMQSVILVKELVASLCYHVESSTIGVGVVGWRYGGVAAMAGVAELGFAIAAHWSGGESPAAAAFESPSQTAAMTVGYEGSIPSNSFSSIVLKAVESRLRGMTLISTPLCLPRLVLGLVHEEDQLQLRQLVVNSCRWNRHHKRDHWGRRRWTSRAEQELSQFLPNGIITDRAFPVLVGISSEKLATQISRELSGWNAWRFLPLLPIPTLLLSAAEDPVCPATALPFLDAIKTLYYCLL
eukprot:Protomagalhaensia_sp_Gyna_25__5084@NODE_57_length_5912_cov_11_254044_g42_i0_p2_GENE_NODE_57_length_5912_cov_11_254044_g42_i0NODE_57_length_5912_cov_11_254044_g42_i0_p2_ORF_typecomplete_len699_score96_96Rota_NS6/PF04866_12/0_07Hydrolase_4/PF12146_8/7_3e03Hydrolase_4/PF12146_8/1_3e04Hydrolase_4/PF12146_8/0_16Abhydrolase_1/PF00561_20/7_3e03Abhydrolase_1/PF00561_20/0_18_NODE_57_length_5912_cov_11_254044_g42_i010843180